MSSRQAPSPIRLTCKMYVALACAALLAGCIIIPLPPDRTPAPSIKNVVPQEIRSSEHEVMVLAQLGELSKSHDTVNAPVFAMGNTLETTVRQFDQASASRFLWGYAVGYGYSGYIDGGLKSYNAKRLVRMCIVTADGLLLTLDPAGDNWGSRQLNRFHTARRDAIVSALRTGGETPFEKIDGPCGLSGKVDWPSQVRSRAIDFIARLPATDLGDMNARLAPIIERARVGESQAAGAMLLYSTNWKGEDLSNRPLFLSRSDFEELKALTGLMSARDVAVLLSGPHSLYSTGNVAIESLDVRRLCVMLANGGIAFWNRQNDEWVFPQGATWRQHAEEVLIANLTSGVETKEVDGNCALDKLMSWTDADFNSVRAFLKLPTVASAQDWLREHMRVRDQPTSAATSTVLLLVIDNSGDGSVYPFFGDSHTEFRTLADVLLSLQPRAAFTALNLGEAAGASMNYCVLGLDAQYLVFTSSSDGTKWTMYNDASTKGTVTFRNEAINALREYHHGYSGAYVCSLEQARWPKETRDRVTAFLENMKVAPATSK